MSQGQRIEGGGREPQLQELRLQDTQHQRDQFHES